MRGFAGLNIIGADLVEVNPLLDHAEMTHHLAVQLLYEIITLMAIAKGDSLACSPDPLKPEMAEWPLL
jgi:agmatinase